MNGPKLYLTEDICQLTNYEIQRPALGTNFEFHKRIRKKMNSNLNTDNYTQLIETLILFD